MKLFLASKSVADRDNLTPSGERLVNCYALPAPEGAISPLIIRSVPGLEEFTTLPGPFLRAMTRVEDKIYAVSRAGLYLIREDGTFASIGALDDDPNTSMVGHRSSVTISANGSYYLWNGSTLTSPGSGRFSSVGSVAFLDQFTLMSELNGREVQWSEAGLPDDLNALYFRTAEARDDDIVRVLEAGAYLAVMKKHSVELWGTTALGGSSAFTRIEGAVSDRGVAGFNLMTKTPEGAFFIGENNVAYLATGTDVVAVSPPNVNQALESGTPTHCFYYDDRGHTNHVIRFDDRPAWVLDGSTGYWHERSSGVDHAPWDVIASVYCYDQWYLGDRSGRIYRLASTPLDVTTPMRRTIVSRPLYFDGDRTTVAELELLGLFGNYSVLETGPRWITDEHGFPITDQLGNYILAEDDNPVHTARRAGKLWLRVSRDGGHTWGLPKTRTIGRVGEYQARCRFLAMGQFRSFTVEVNMTDPVDVPLLAEANLILG